MPAPSKAECSPPSLLRTGPCRPALPSSKQSVGAGRTQMLQCSFRGEEYGKHTDTRGDGGFVREAKAGRNQQHPACCEDHQGDGARNVDQTPDCQCIGGLSALHGGCLNKISCSPDGFRRSSPPPPGRRRRFFLPARPPRGSPYRSGPHRSGSGPGRGRPRTGCT